MLPVSLPRFSWAWLNRAPWFAVIAISLSCGVQAARLAWAEYDLTEADPTRRLQAPETYSRIQRAAHLELDGHPRAAEHELLIAAANDRRFVPAWALANFYQRQRRPADFWPWAHRAARMSHGERSALFHLMLQMGPASHAAESLPASLQTEFATYLVSAGRLDDALKQVTANNAPLSLTLADRLISCRRFADALVVWNRSQTVKLDARHPTLVDPAFENEPAGLGFGWRLGAGAAHSAGRIDIALQPGEFLSQYVVLRPGQQYRLIVQQDPMASTKDLRWQMDDLSTSSNLLRDAPAVDPTRTSQTFEFQALPQTGFARLALASSGAARGVYGLRRVSLEFAP